MGNSMRRIFRDGTFTIAFLSACLFLLGWFYFYGYYTYFDLDPQTLDLSTNTTLIFGGRSVVQAFLRLLPFLSGGFIGASLIYFIAATPWGRRPRRWYRPDDTPTMANDRGIALNTQSEPLPSPTQDSILEKSKKLPGPVFIIPFIIGLLMSLILVAVSRGHNDAEQQYQRPRSKVHLNFKKDDEKAFDEKLVSANKSDNLRLLVQTKDLIVVFVQGKIEEGVFIIPQANLLSTHNQRIPRKK